MFAALEKLFAGRAGSDDRQAEPIDHRVATAALLVHAVAVDGAVTAAERDMVLALTSAHFDLSDGEARRLMERATAIDREAVDLYGFTQHILARPEAERLQIMEMLWAVVYADGRLHEFEDNLLWRIGELIGVSNRDRVLLRKRVRERNRRSGGDPQAADETGQEG